MAELTYISYIAQYISSHSYFPIIVVVVVHIIGKVREDDN